MARKYFYISPALGLQFSLIDSSDNCETFPTPDNQTYCSDGPEGYYISPYYQLYQNCDTITIQFRSDYSTHQIDLLDKQGASVSTYAPSLIQSDVQESFTHQGFVRDNTGAQVRVYFDQITIPEIGDSLTITNNVSYNGSYTVISQGFDSELGKSFVIISSLFAGQDFDPVTISIPSSEVVYSLYEFSVDFALIQSGLYRVSIAASESGFDDSSGLSEWVDIKQIHNNSKLLEYRNSVNDFAIDYSTGISNKVRVYSYFFKRKPQGEQTTYYDKDKLIKIHAKTRRFTDFEVPQVPPWMNEKLTLIFGHDFFTVNGIEHQTEEVYQPEYIDQYSLSSGSISLEQVNWTGDFNVGSEPYLYCSPANSLTFTLSDTLDSCNALPNHDNTTYCDDKQGNYSIANYLQPFQNCDLITIQFRSNYQDNSVSVVDAQGQEQLSPVVTEVINGTTGNESYEGVAINDNTGPETKVYFNQAVFPELSVGDTLTISNTSSFNGGYLITSFGYDILRNKEFATINNSAIPPAEEQATISVSNSSLGYNVYQFQIAWSDLGVGIYRVKISVDDVVFGDSILISEWVSIKESHPQTYFLKYKNSFDSFGVDYSTGIDNTIRIPAYFYKRTTAGDSDTYTDAETTVKFGSTVRRQIALEVVKLPPYMHEKLALAFSHDFFSVNGIEFQTEELYEPEYIDQYTLSSGSLSIQQVNWIGAAQESEQSDEIYLLVEDGHYLLLENMDKIILG